jgi:ketosteroid isomerase-like protein
MLHSSVYDEETFLTLVTAMNYSANSAHFSTELQHPKLRSLGQADLCPLANRGGLIVINRCLVFLLCLLAALPAATAQRPVRARTSIDSAGDQQSIREVLEIEREAKEASLRRDPEFPQKMLADDYVAISPLGQITTKKEAISARKSGQLRYDTIDISDIVVRLYGDTAIVTARADVKGHQLGEDFSGPYRYTRVWVRKAGHWQAVSYQATVTQ